jgi:hypothetical protein
VKEDKNDLAELPGRPISPNRNFVTEAGLAAIEAALGRFEAAHRAATDKGDREAAAAALRCRRIAVSVFAALGDTTRPKSFADPFNAAPSAACASLSRRIVRLRRRSVSQAPGSTGWRARARFGKASAALAEGSRSLRKKRPPLLAN